MANRRKDDTVTTSKGKKIQLPRTSRAQQIRKNNRELMREKIKGQAHLREIIKT